jgi:glycosyltransferase involved in cell wall biosynthesis
VNSDLNPRVVLCTPGFPSSADDFDKPFLLDHAVALTQAGLEVTVVCPAVPGLPSRHVVAGVEVIRVRYAPRRFETLATTGSMYREARSIRGVWAVSMMVAMTITTIRQLKPRSAIAYGHWWIPGGIVAAIAARCMRRSSLIHLHGSDATVTQSAAIRLLGRKILRMADVRMAVSDELANWAQELCNKPVQVLPMPLVFERFSAPSPPPEDGYVLAVGRLVPEKGFDVLIDAVSLLEKAQRPKVTIIGVGPERQRLAEQARRKAVEIHLPGAVSPNQMSDWYRDARYVVVPSRREGFGLVAAEAAAMGRAVVGTTVGGISAVVQDGVSGILVEPGDAEDLAQALLAVDPAMGEVGPSMVAVLSSERHGSYLRQICEDFLN